LSELFSTSQPLISMFISMEFSFDVGDDLFSIEFLVFVDFVNQEETIEEDY